MIRFVGARRGLRSKSIFPSQSIISVCPRASSVRHFLSHSFGTGVSPATRFPSCWTLKYYASSTSVELAGNSRPICYSKKQCGIADNALHYFLSHDSRLCVLYFAANIQEGHIHVSRNSTVSENMRHFALVWKLLLQVTFCISGTLGCNDIRGKSELSL